MKRLGLFLAFTALILTGCGGSASDSLVTPVAYGEIPVAESVALPLPGRSAPDFEFGKEIEGAERLSELQGRVVVINFWATWCPYCVKEIPALEAVYRRYQDQGVVVLGVDVGESPEQVAEFKRTTPFTYPLVYDRTEKIFRSYWGRSLPVTFVVDQEGIISGILFGQTSEEIFENAILRLLD